MALSLPYLHQGRVKNICHNHSEIPDNIHFHEITTLSLRRVAIPEGHFPGPPEVPERDALAVVGGDDEPRVGGVELHRVEGLGALVRRKHQRGVLVSVPRVEDPHVAVGAGRGEDSA